MAWTEGKQRKEPLIDYNEKYERELIGELPDDVAKKTFARFLMYNIGYLIMMLTGFQLYPYQRLMVKGWLAKNNTLTVASRGLGKCIDENATVLTENGFKPIKETFVGERIWANKSFQTIEAKLTNPEESGFEVTTNSGFNCTGKNGHKLYCLSPHTWNLEWKNIEDLTGKELIPIRKGMSAWGNSNPVETFDSTKRFNQAKNVTLTHEPDLYYLMGLILGDGCVRLPGSTIQITSADQEIGDTIHHLVPRYIEGANVYSDSKGKDAKAKAYNINSVIFKRFLTHMGFTQEKAHKKEFPKQILKVDKPYITAFLRGLFDTDGYCHVKHHKEKNRWSCGVELSSSSWDIIKKVQSILLNLGIVSTIRHKHKAGPQLFSNGKTYQTNDSWVLDINNRAGLEIFSREIGFGLTRKQERLDQYLANCMARPYAYNLIPIGDYLRKTYTQPAFSRQGIKKLHRSVSLERLKEIKEFSFITSEDKSRFDELTNTEYYFDAIKAIKPVKTVTVDIQVANEACYWSEGFINHNSMVFSHFCYLYCLFNPGKRIVMVSETFRSSRRIVENIATWAAADRGILLRQCIVPQPKGDLLKKRQDLFEIEFKNGASIVALPMGGDPEKLRGYRCSVLGIDEGLRIPQVVIDTVLKPFLVATDVKEIQRRQHIRRREDAAIKNGRMTEEDRAEFTSNNKMIILSSASYAWQDLFALYKQYLSRIFAEDRTVLKNLSEDQKAKLLEEVNKEVKKEKEKDPTGQTSFLVHQLSYKVMHRDALDATMREELEGDTMSENTKRREYGAEFVQDSDGYFRAKIMEECTLKGDTAPTVEIVGDPLAQYLMAIDPNGAGSDTADHFAILIIKIVEREKADGTKKKVGLVVHQYANAGAELKHHFAYILYLWEHFNIVYIAADTSQGDNSDIINIVNESEMFKSKKIGFKPIDANFGKETFDDLVDEIQKSYNKAEGRIVQKQYFHSAFQKAANEHLQDSFGRRSILFAAKAAASPNAMDIMRDQDVGSIINSHPAFVTEGAEGSRGSMDDFVNHQDALIDLVKTECALIEVKVSSLGNISFDLPAHMKKQKDNPARVRKDNYSALVLGNWALKLYLEAQDRPPPSQEAPFYASFVNQRQ